MSGEVGYCVSNSPVRNDYNKFRDFEARKQFDRSIIKSIVLLVATAEILVVSLYFATPELPIIGVFLIELLFGMVVVVPIILHRIGRNRTRMKMAHQGYNIKENSAPPRWFGRGTYNILKADPGNLQSAIGGINTNPFETSIRELQSLEKKQRENAVCDICNEPLFEPSVFNSTGGYFVETREQTWLFRLPISETVVEWEAYCPEHKPNETE